MTILMKSKIADVPTAVVIGVLAFLSLQCVAECSVWLGKLASVAVHDADNNLVRFCVQFVEGRSQNDKSLRTAKRNGWRPNRVGDVSEVHWPAFGTDLTAKCKNLNLHNLWKNRTLK